MTVKELIELLNGMPDMAEVYVIPDGVDGYKKVMDCECEFSDTVSLGCEMIKDDLQE